MSEKNRRSSVYGPITKESRNKLPIYPRTVEHKKHKEKARIHPTKLRLKAIVEEAESPMDNPYNTNSESKININFLYF